MPQQLFAALLLFTIAFVAGCNKDADKPAETKTDSTTSSQQTPDSGTEPNYDAKNESNDQSLTNQQTDMPNTAASANDKTPDETDVETPDASATLKNEETPDGNALTLRCLTWNVESEGSDSEVIASQLANDFPGYDLFALTEVLPQDFDRFENAIGKNFDAVRTKTGFNDRMQIIFNTDKFELVRKLELHEINNERHRSPLVAHLKQKSNGLEFLVMVNHLARGNADFRTEQAGKLVDWARDQTLPIIALGDYNFDYEFSTKQGNEGFREFLRDNIYTWVEPNELIDTNWFDPEPDGKDNYPGSMLDFAFVAGQAKEWQCSCDVIVREGDFPDTKKTSDHRPVSLTVIKP